MLKLWLGPQHLLPGPFYSGEVLSGLPIDKHSALEDKPAAEDPVTNKAVLAIKELQPEK